MAEKRQRRAQKSQNLQRQSVNNSLPKPKFDYSTTSSSLADPPSSSPSSSIDGTATAVPPPPLEQQDGNNEAAEVDSRTKAQQLLESQRESVAMLTLVKERLEQQLQGDATLQSSLQKDGYCFCDGFLQNDETLNRMFQQAVDLLPQAELDLAGGMGEYVVSSLDGEHYPTCPRILEFVVSATKHLPDLLEKEIPNLDNAHCLANLRIFDRQAWKASRDLLTTTVMGGDNTSDRTTEEEKEKEKEKDALVSNDDEQEDDHRPLAPLVNDPDQDIRRLSVYYYLLDPTWSNGSGGGGGGLRFANRDSEGDKPRSFLVEAQHDRLIMFYTDRTPLEAQNWKGGDENFGEDNSEYACRVELHLVTKVS